MKDEWTVFKYQALGLETRARALAGAPPGTDARLRGLGRTREAIASLEEAVALARSAGDPALFVRVATTLLAIAGDDGLATEARAAVGRITAALPEGDLRRRFEASKPVRLLG